MFLLAFSSSGFLERKSMPKILKQETTANYNKLTVAIVFRHIHVDLDFEGYLFRGYFRILV